jgi:transcriptional regulator with XRE-family HTH domain
MNGDLTFGQRLRWHRERAGMSRTVLGGLVGKSEEWVKAVETGRLQMPRLPILLRIAEVLHIDDLAELTGSQHLQVAEMTKNAHDDLALVRDALVTHRLPVATEPPDLDALSARVAYGWEQWHGQPDHRTAVAAVLPDLIQDVRVAARYAEDRRRALVLLAKAHSLAQAWVAFQPGPELVWLAADRALSAAYEADNPVAVAGAAWYAAQVYQAGGQVEKAVEVSMDAASLLPGLDAADEELRACFGLAHLAASWAYAQGGHEGQAWREWDIADQAVHTLGDYVHPWLMFGRGVVDNYATLIDTELFHAARAVDRANQIDLGIIPSRTRRAVHALNAARAYSLHKEHLATLHLIGQAHRHAPETVRYRPWARATVLELMHTGGPAVRNAARDAADMVGALV